MINNIICEVIKSLSSSCKSISKDTCSRLDDSLLHVIVKLDKLSLEEFHNLFDDTDFFYSKEKLVEKLWWR